VPVASPEYFANEKANWLHTVVIDQELVRYRAVSATPPWMLVDCERGAFGTRAATHRTGAFSAALRERLKNPALEFHLAPVGGGAWDLYPFHASGPFRHERVVGQPGEPTISAWTVTNPDDAQPIQFRLQVVGAAGGFSRPTLEVDGAGTVVLPVDLKAGESVVCDGTPVVRVYDAKGRQTSMVTLAAPPPRLAPGSHRISLDGTFSGDEAPRIEVIVKTRGAAERVRAARRAEGDRRAAAGTQHR